MNFLLEPSTGSSLKTLPFVSSTVVNSICLISPPKYLLPCLPPRSSPIHILYFSLKISLKTLFFQKVFQFSLSHFDPFLFLQQLSICVRDGQLLLNIHTLLLPFQLQAYGNLATDISYPFLLIDVVIYLSSGQGCDSTRWMQLLDQMQ